MKNIQTKKLDDEKKTIDSSIARVSGAVRVASSAVSTAIAIKNEAVDEVESMKTKSNDKASNRAIKKIETETKKGLTSKNH